LWVHWGWQARRAVRRNTLKLHVGNALDRAACEGCLGALVG
jgi:hypothetical protein